ncbi:Ornithine-acyl[acyl carrier protein] N-acyltransferase [Sulfitobacter noctilucae]|uniref:GNAT family N-acetyltransferase n=1 Tax=Sulfitobacter noctilucae TaxID=1342302 RepID=UPI000467F1BC|nr:GNAT family N-acyltransferase [Sulfitobacter noctilucae]KIN61147.1 Ornithine-acyl[acyl carrier protein] N-acyltransferase [Sulfitobacter noctilucae]
MTRIPSDQFDVTLATSTEDLRAAQRLRYDVFITELGGSGPLVDHDTRLEQDRFDPFYDHLLLREKDSGAVIGVYRLMHPENALKAGGYYCEAEFDLSPLLASGRRVMELGRSCVRADHRGGMAMFHLWSALARYVADHRIDVLFGAASFQGTEIAPIAPSLSLLHQRHLAPPDLRVRAHEKAFQNMDLVAKADLDARTAMTQMPSLMKAYLRSGGYVGEGAFVDHAFNTVDVCLILDTARLSDRQARMYKGQGA